MKKVIFLAVLMVAMISFSQSVKAQTPVQFNLSMEVAKYIETTPSPLSFNFGTATYNQYFGSPGNMDLYQSAENSWDLAYANCGFSVTLSGDNPAGQGVPRFSRAEQGDYAIGFDILNTVYQIGIWTNGEVQNDAFGKVWGIGASSFPITGTFAETPHNGQVRMTMRASVNSHWHPSKDAGIPIREAIINSNFTNQQSADAGTYTCTMLVTLAAI